MLASICPAPHQQKAQAPAMVQCLGIQIGGMSASRPQVPGGVQGRHDRIRTPVNGISVVVETGVGYELGVIGDEQVRRSEEHTSELQSLAYLVCRLLLEKKKKFVYLV